MSHDPNNLELDMICTDIDGDRCVVDRFVDHKHVEVAFWANGYFQFDGTRVRMDELTPTGETYVPRPAFP